MVKSRSSSRSSMSVKSITGPKFLTSENVWKFSLFLLLISLVLLIIIISMPGNIYINMDSNMGIAMNVCSFLGSWIGIVAWIYRLANRKPVLKYFVIGLTLAFILPSIIVYVTHPEITQPPPAHQLRNILKL